MSADPVSAGPRGDLPNVDRLLALSDGVVAIAITLLVLQLNVPSPAKFHDPNSASELARQLGIGADRLVSYVISFYVIAQFWLVHHRVFGRITGQEEGLAWWNFAFLFTITIMPFTSDLLGEFAANPLAVDIFAANLLLASVATQLTVTYGNRKGLLTPETAQETRAAHFRVAASILVIALSIGIAWVNPNAAKYCWLLLAVAPRIADRWSARQPALPVTGNSAHGRAAGGGRREVPGPFGLKILGPNGLGGCPLDCAPPGCRPSSLLTLGRPPSGGSGTGPARALDAHEHPS